jgi:ZIP family zinc transporter
MTYDAIVWSAGAFVSTLAGGLAAVRLRDHLGVVMAFASGVLIAVPLFDLLPESLSLAVAEGVPIRQVMYATAVGFLSLYTLERYFSVHRVCEGEVCRNVRHPKGGTWGAIELSLHSFVDGFAIGTGFHVSFQVGLVVAVAVIAHDFSDGINTVTVMLKSGNSLRSALGMLVLDALTPLLGAASAQFLLLPERFLVLLLPFFAGGFLYLGAGDLLPEAHETNPPLVALLSSFAGFAVVFAVTALPNL